MASPPFRSAGASTFINNSASVPKPAGVVSGDALIMVTQVKVSDANVTLPSGWAVLDSYDTGSIFASEYQVAWKLAGGSEPSTYTVGIGGSGSNNTGVCTILAYSGPNPAAPFDAHTVIAQTTPSLSVVCPSIITTLADCTLVCVYGDRNDQAVYTFTPPPGMTARVSVSDAFGFSHQVSDKALSAAGATGTQTATGSASHQYVAFSFAIASAPPPPTATISITEQAETVDVQVAVPVSAIIGVTEQSETIAIVGSVAGSVSAAIAITEQAEVVAVTAGAVVGTITTGPFGNNTVGGLLPNLTGLTVSIVRLSDMVQVLTVAGGTTGSDSCMTISSTSLTPGTAYVVTVKDAAGTIGAEKYTAA